MDIRSLRQFILVAQLQHFGQAAEQIGIAQPALSQKIKALETRLRVKLFDRSHKKVRLTEAGQVFYAEACELVAKSDQAIRMTRDAESGLVGELRIGYGASLLFDPTVCKLIKKFHDLYPRVALRMQEKSVEEQIDGIINDRLDIVFLRGPVGPAYRNIKIDVLCRTPLAVAFPNGHALCYADSVTMDDIRDETFIGLADPPGSGVGHIVSQLFEQENYAPRILLHVSGLMSILGLVGAGLGIGIVPYLPTEFSCSAFALRPLKAPNAYSEIIAASSKRSISHLVECFLTCLDI